MTGPLSISHPDMLALLVDVEAEHVNWAQTRTSNRARYRMITYTHDDGRDVTAQLVRFDITGMIYRCCGPGLKHSGTVELTAAGVLHLNETPTPIQDAPA